MNDGLHDSVKAIVTESGYRLEAGSCGTIRGFWPKGSPREEICRKDRLERLRKWLSQSPEDSTVVIGSSSLRGPYRGYTVLAIRRGVRVWVVRCGLGSSGSDAVWRWVGLARHPLESDPANPVIGDWVRRKHDGKT